MKTVEMIVVAPEDVISAHLNKMAERWGKLKIAAGVGVISALAIPFFPPAGGVALVDSEEVARNGLGLCFESLRFHSKYDVPSHKLPAKFAGQTPQPLASLKK